MKRIYIICLSLLFTTTACDQALGELPSACAADGARHNCPKPKPPPPDCGPGSGGPPCPGTTKGTVKIKLPDHGHG